MRPHLRRAGSTLLIPFLAIAPASCQGLPSGEVHPEVSPDGIREVPGSQLTPPYKGLFEFDVAVDSIGRFHVLWYTRTSAEDSRSGLWHQMAQPGTHDWSPAMALDSLRGERARIVATPARLHAIDSSLRHYEREYGDAPWRQVGTFRAPRDGRPQGLDVTCAGETLLVAYIAAERKMSAEERERLAPRQGADEATLRAFTDMPNPVVARRLHLVRYLPGGKMERTVLASFDVSTEQSPGPRLIWWGERLHLICGVGLVESKVIPQNGGTLTKSKIMGQILHFSSPDGGRTWSRSRDLPLGETIDAPDVPAFLPLFAPDIAVAATDGGLWTFFTPGSVMIFHSVDGESWTRAGYPGCAPAEKTSLTSIRWAIDAVGAGRRVMLGWPDVRYVRSDRDRSDLMLLALGDADASRDPLGSLTGKEAECLTPAGWGAGCVRLAVLDSTVRCVWIGRMGPESGMSSLLYRDLPLP